MIFYYILQGLIALVSLFVGGVILVILGLLITSIVSGFFIKKIDYNTHSRFYKKLLVTCMTFAMWLVRVKVKVNGKEKLKNQGKFLFVCNHRSNLDPIMTTIGLKEHDIAFISKKENFNIIIYGKIIRKCCFRAIDRENARNAIKTIRDCSELIKSEQVSVGVYPEGTRSKSKELLPFHDGVFKIASLANAPLVIATVKGGEDFTKRYPFRKTTVQIDILEVIDKEKVKEFSTHEIADYTRNLMLNHLEK